nr:MAG TPA: PADR1 domain protein [Caudoviricetes sp.]
MRPMCGSNADDSGYISGRYACRGYPSGTLAGVAR